MHSPPPPVVVDPYGAIYRGAIFPAWEALMKRPTVERLRYLEQSQWSSRAELQRRQMVSLSTLLRHAFENVAYYRRKFREAGLHPNDIRVQDDLRFLPLLTRDEVCESLAERSSLAPPFPTIQKTTSGSTGEPITVIYDEESEHWRQAVKWRCYAWANFRPGDRVMHYWGAPQKRPSASKWMKMKLDRVVRRERYVDCVAQDEATLARAVETIRRFKPAVIISYAQAGGNLARYINQVGARTWGSIPFICTAEQLFLHDRLEIERAFGPQVYDSYGGRETMLLAMECGAHHGLHVSIENILLEILVTDADGRQRQARPGETGEVVVTDLHNLGAPLIRYANGDLAKAMHDGPCACGRALPRIKSVEGRKVDTLVDGFGGQVHGMLFPVLMLPLAHSIKQYQAVQHKDRSITVRVVPSPDFDDQARRFITQSLTRAIRGVPIDLSLVDEIPVTPSGKRHAVIVEL